MSEAHKQPGSEQSPKKTGFLEQLRDRPVTAPENPRETLKKMAAGATTEFSRRLLNGALGMDAAQADEQKEAAKREAANARDQKYKQNLEDRMVQDAAKIAKGPNPDHFDPRDKPVWVQKALKHELPVIATNPLEEGIRARQKHQKTEQKSE